MEQERLGSPFQYVYWPALPYVPQDTVNWWLTRGIEWATAGKSSHVPYAEIEKRQTRFIESKYLPRNTKIRQPRNLTKAVIMEIFEHLLERQKMHGPDETFRFKSVKSGDNIIPAQYPRDKGNADAGAGRRSKDYHPRHDRASAQVLQNTREYVIHQHYDADGVPSNTGCNEGTFVIVDDALMSRLHTIGIAMPVPCNGPSDGPPKYPIPCRIYEGNNIQLYLKSMTQSPVIDPTLLTMPTPSPTPTPGPGLVPMPLL
jgi:hypothetical protein